MAALPASGGVRSLLAKFENNSSNGNSNNADGSPPSRGRSGESDDNAASRPLSKVRASFVSVERNSQGSPTPGLLRRTDSYGADRDSSQRSAAVSPSTQLETASINSLGTSPQKVRTPLASFPANEPSTTKESRPAPAVKEEGPKPSAAPEADAAKPPPTKTTQKTADKPVNATTEKLSAPSRTIKKSSSTMAISKDPSTANPASKPTASKEKKPAAPTTKTTTTSSRAATPSDKPTAPARSTAAKSATTASRTERASTPSRDTARNTTAQPSPRTKTGTRSPTRPVRLPASLVTPTAASSAKTGNLARSQSHANLKSSPSTASPKALSRKPSTLRPDVSRLAAHSIPDRPKSRVSTTSSRGAQEDSFLARMMRPTASSASKVHDRVEPKSPPKLASAAKISRKSDVVPQAPKLATDKSRGSKREPASEASKPKAEKADTKMESVPQSASPQTKPDTTKSESVAAVVKEVAEPSVTESPKIVVADETKEDPATAPVSDADKPVEDVPVEKEPVKEEVEKKVETPNEEQSKDEPAEELPVEAKPEAKPEAKEPGKEPVEEQPLKPAESSTPVADASPEAKDQVEEPVVETKAQGEPKPEQPEQPISESTETADKIPAEPEAPSEKAVSTAEEPASVDAPAEKDEESKAEAVSEQI